MDVKEGPNTAEALAGGVAVLPPLEGVTTRLSHTGASPIAGPSVLGMTHTMSRLSAKSGPDGLGAGNGIDQVYQPPPPLSTSKQILIGSIVTLSMCVNSGSGMGLTIALPAIQTELDMLEADLQWVTSVYALTAGGFLLLSGRLSDVYGRKLVFCTGLVWTAVWTLIGGFMKNGAALIITRALAGIGQAMSTPSAIGIIATNFSGQARSTAFAAFSAGAPIGAAFGMVIGGLLTAYTPHTWRAFLWTIASLAAGIAAIAIIWTPRDKDTQTVTDKRVDWVGAALVTVGLILMMFAISDGETAPNGWATGYIIALLVVGIFLVVAFFLWESYLQRKTTRPPLMRLQLWTRSKGRLASVYFIGAITWMCFQSLFYHATLFFQQVQMTGPVGATLRFLPASASGIICNVLVALLVSRVPTQWIICTGILSTGLASIWFALSEADVLYWRLPFQGMWMAVLGADFLMATGSIFVAALANPEEQSVAGAVFQTMIQLGGAFGLAFTTIINTTYHARSLAAGVPAVAAQLNGLHAAFWLGAAFAGLALALAVVMLRGMGTVGKGKKVKKAPSSSTEVSVDVGLPMASVEAGRGVGEGKGDSRRSRADEEEEEDGGDLRGRRDVVGEKAV